MGRRFVTLLLGCLMLFLLLSGCTKHYKTNYIKKFRAYLNYSLGPYEVLEEEQIHWRANPLPVKGSGYRWVVAFSDDRGIQREFEFRNYGYTQGGDKPNFGYAVMDYALGLGEEQINADVLSKYFKPEEIGLHEYETNATQTSVAVFSEYPSMGNDYYASFVDPKKGLRLKSIHPKQLVNDWGTSYKFKFFTLINDEDQIKELLAKIEQTLRDYAEYVDNYDLLPVEVEVEDYGHGYYGTYDKEKDSFTWITIEEYHESLRYIDGHLKELGSVIVNGKEYKVRKNYEEENIYVFANQVKYCTTTKQYHIDDFEDLLALLGITVSKLDHGNYKWKLGSDTYLVNKYGGWTLKKNGEKKNLLQYHAHECGGLSQTDFEMVSNTTVYVDEEKEALVVTSQ